MYDGIQIVRFDRHVVKNQTKDQQSTVNRT